MRRAFFLAGILGGVIPHLASGQAPPPSVSPVLTSTFADSVVVTASLDEAEQDEAARSVTVLDRAAIDARQTTDVLDLLATVPGLSVAQSGSPGSVSSVFSRGANSNQTLVLWNGLVLNDPFFGGYDWAFLGTEGLERVEIVRGPSSTLHGSHAMGATVQLLTGRQRGIGVDLEGGSDSYARGSLRVGLDPGDEFHLDLVTAIRGGDGQIENDFYDATDILARGEWKARKGLTLGLLARFDDSEIGIPRSGATLTPQRRQDSRSLDVSIPVDLLVGDWALDAHLSRVDSDFAFHDPESSFSLNDTQAERLQGRLVATWAATEGTRISFGGDWQEATVENVSNFGSTLNDAKQTNTAVFAEVRRSFDRLSMEAALRYDDNDAFGGEASPSVGAVVTLAKGTLLRATYGEGFRAPALGELFFPFSGNPNLQPETSESSEISLEHRSGPVTVSAAAFDNRQTNLVDFDSVTFTNMNIGRARSSGVEARVAFLGGPFQGELNGTYLDAENRDTGEPLLRRPEESLNLILTYRPNAWSFNLTGRYVGSRPDADPITFATTTNPSYTRFDFAVRWQALERLQPYARVENLADASYEEVLGFPAPGATFIGGVRWIF